MGQGVTVRVGIPHGSLSHNGRAHWRTISSRRKQQRQSAWAATLEALTNNPLASVAHKGNAWKSARIDVAAFYKKKNGPGVDADNLIGSLKGAVDGIVDAGLLADDNGVEWGKVEIVYGDKDPRVELTVTSL